MKATLCACIFIVFQLSVYGQEKKVNKKWTESEHVQMEKAQLFFAEKNYRLAFAMFEKLQANHPTESNLKYLCGVTGLSRPTKQAVCLQFLKEVQEKNKKAGDIEYYLAKANLLNNNIDEAIAGLASYASKLKKPTAEQKQNIEELTTYCNNAKLLMANPVAVKIENLGNTINTAGAEYEPNLTEDESVIVYTYVGEKSKGGLQNAFNQPNKNGVYYEDVFTSTKESGVWKQPQEVAGLNTNNNESALYLSGDGQKLFINVDSQKDDGDIYMCTKDKDTWGSQQKLGADVNSNFWEDNCSLAPDGKTLYFSSSRPGGFGGKDLYSSTLLPNGSWSKAHNLGNKINTAKDEDAPFMHYDGKLLLFSSQAHNSIGGFDIFKTWLTDTTWAEPENMGYPINTTQDDNYYVLSPSGETGYYSLGRTDGFGDLDIYKVEPGITGTMPAVSVTKGIVSLDGKPAAADITVETIPGNTVFKTSHSDIVSGKYLITLPVGQDYKISWKLNELPPQSEMIEASKATAYLLKLKDVSFTTKKDTAIADTLWHTGNEQIEGLVYKIQVSAQYLNEKIRRRKARKLGKIDKEVVGDVARYTLKEEYKTFNEATARVKKVRELIVADAFIIGIYKGKRVYLADLRAQGILKIK